MDLQVGVIISIVFLVSFLSYLFISKFLPHGKTFDEMIAEKKKMREEMLGTLKPANNKFNTGGNKRKPKKEVKKKDSPKVQAPKPSPPESEEEDDENFGEEMPEIIVPPRPTINKRKAKKKSSESEEVEEVVKEVRQVAAAIEPSTSSPTQSGNKNKPQQQNQHSKKKGKGGILVNKNEPILVKDNPVVEEAVNHFEEIHPKDALEIQRMSTVAEEKNTRNFRENKKNKKETPPVSPKNQPVKEVAVKQKKNFENTAVATVVDGQISDEASITPLIRDLSRADLTKSQIQVLIDFLLNKQSDTIIKDPTEWTEGKSDPLQKLKKQLQEKEAQLKNEQDALSGMQMKLKDLRAEFNNEKIQSNATIKAHMEQLNILKAEITRLQKEMHDLNEKNTKEKMALTATCKQLQQKYFEASESLKTFESLPNIQKIQADNQLLQNEIISKNQQINELNLFVEENRKMEEIYKQKVTECDSKISDMEVHLRKKDEAFVHLETEMRQRVQDLANRDSEIQKLSSEIVHVREILQTQTIEKEQLTQQINTLHQNNHAEENKIEIRNLQNALDSSKKELESQRALVNDYKMRIEDLSKQLAEAKQLTQKSGDSFLLNEKLNEMTVNHQNIIGEKDKQLAEYKKQIENLQKTESELSKQIEEQKAKNNDLRMKNWKLVEALQAAQTSSSSKMTSNHSNNSVAHENGIDVKMVKDLITQYFPDHCVNVSSSNDETKWLKSVLENLKTAIVSNNQSNHSTSSPINANHLNNNTNNCHDDVERNNSSTKTTLNGDTNSTTSPSDNESVILLQNAQLRKSIEDYKTIISDTESMLKNLEAKVREQDAYWTKVVLMKDNEIENLKSHVQQS